MSAKNIEIRFNIAGGDQAATEIRKVESAGTSMAESMAKGSEEAKKLSDDVGDIARAQKATALAGLAEDAGKLGQKFREAADEVEEFDKDAADALRNTARHIEDVSSGISTVAAGFATGGPLGSALAAAGVLIQSLANKWQEGELAAMKAAASEKAAMNEVEEATRNASTAAQERATAIDNAGALQSMEAELAKSREITAELERQLGLHREKRDLENELLNSRDRTELERINKQVASGEITPEQAADQRDQIEAAAQERAFEERKRRAIEDAVIAGKDALSKKTAADSARGSADDLAARRDKASQTATELADSVSKEISQMVPNSKTGELSDSDKSYITEMEAEIERARSLVKALDEAAKKAETAAAEAERQAEDARSKAGDRNSSARETIETVDALQEEDSRRRGLRSQSRSAVRASRAEDEASTRRDGIEKSARAAAGLGLEAAEDAGALGNAAGARALKGKAMELMDNPSKKGTDELIQLMERFVEWAERRQAGAATEGGRVSRLEQRIGNLEGQIKNARTGR